MPKILLIGSSFFGYRDRVAAELRRQGYEVDALADRPSESVAFRSVAKVAPRMLSGAIARYAESLAVTISEGGYDRVIYMGGMTFLFTHEQMERMRAAAPDVKFTAYLWDSVSNSPILAQSLDLFDSVFSFEPADCELYDLNLRPLFYTGIYANTCAGTECGFDYDACFVGSVHQPSKFVAIRRICDELEASGLRVFKYFFMPSKSVAALRKATDSVYWGASFQFEPLSSEEVAMVYARSRAIIDSPQGQQTGLTMRTLEAVGAHRKLITTNADVINYDFFSEENVAVWDGEDGIDADFFDRPYRELPGEILARYSIESFTSTLVGSGTSFEGYSKGVMCR